MAKSSNKSCIIYVKVLKADNPVPTWIPVVASTAGEAMEIANDNPDVEYVYCARFDNPNIP